MALYFELGGHCFRYLSFCTNKDEHRAAQELWQIMDFHGTLYPWESTQNLEDRKLFYQLKALYFQIFLVL